MFFPGETITHSFTIPFLKGDVSKIIATYKQNDHIILEKTLSDKDMTDIDEHYSLLQYSFSQLDSLCFEDNSDFYVQLNVITKANSRHTSNEMKSSNAVQYVREVI